MKKKASVLNQNRQVLGMLARELGKWNRGRNKILMGAVVLCIVTLTMVFGISIGKTKAEYIKAVRAAGSTASVWIEQAENEIYQKTTGLSYVKESGRGYLWERRQFPKNIYVIWRYWTHLHGTNW